MIGRSVAHYLVTQKLGEGGMGEVYRATDQKLKREVALKFLPARFTDDPDRLARFQREAEVLARLAHPNIGAIYGLEEAGTSRVLVLELVEGGTLAERVAGHPIPFQEAARIALLVAQALEAAHEKGIVHRDLKPANVKITPQGRVKVLDFGLAKVLDEAADGGDSSAAPTRTEALTRAGAVVGTAAFMSPEQARGDPVDKRADIWAFGCLLYEALTGERPFRAKTVPDTLAAVLKEEPNWDRLAGRAPWRIRDLVDRCLRKNPRDRLRDIGDARIELQRALLEPRTSVTPADRVRGPWLRWWWAAILLALGALGSLAVVWMLAPAPVKRPVIRTDVTLPQNQRLTAGPFRVLAISPDGRQLVYRANDQLYRRPMDRLTAVSIPGTEDARTPFFSPDGQWLAFWAFGEIRKIRLDGGAVRSMASIPPPLGASWDGNSIFFGMGARGIGRVPAGGGEIETLIGAKTGESYFGPQLLPGGRALLFTLRSGARWDNAQVVVQVLSTGKRHVLIAAGTDGRYVPTGHLVYGRAGALYAVPFDPVRLVVGGPARQVAKGVQESRGAVQFTVSASGSLVYWPGSIEDATHVLVWVDRQGREESLSPERGMYFWPRLSPDGRRLALSEDRLDNQDIWVYDLADWTSRRLTFNPALDVFPIWTPDGKRVVFVSDREGARRLYSKAADGTGRVEQLGQDTDEGLPSSWAPDGKHLAVYMEVKRGSWDLDLLSLEGKPSMKPLLETPFNELRPAISPDGRWIAYQSNESGRSEIYVRPFPHLEEGKWQVSSNGGFTPLWRGDGKELFYRHDDEMVAVPISSQPAFTAGIPRTLFSGRYLSSGGRNYDVSPDGRRFLMVKTVAQGSRNEAAPSRLIYIENWFAQADEQTKE